MEVVLAQQGARTERRDKARNSPGKRRYFDPKYDAVTVKVLPGEYYISRDPDEMLVTVLGSCVSACIRHPESGMGGMNHFMLPEEGEAAEWRVSSAALRYGTGAMETLINAFLRRGIDRDALEIKVFGGANVIGSASRDGVGSRNAAFVNRYLKNEGFQIMASDLGGAHARRIHFTPRSGKVSRLFLRRRDDQHVFEDEVKFRRQLKPRAGDGDVELFS